MADKVNVNILRKTCTSDAELRKNELREYAPTRNNLLPGEAHARDDGVG